MLLTKFKENVIPFVLLLLVCLSIGGCDTRIAINPESNLPPKQIIITYWDSTTETQDTILVLDVATNHVKTYSVSYSCWWNLFSLSKWGQCSTTALGGLGAADNPDQDKFVVILSGYPDNQKGTPIIIDKELNVTQCSSNSIPRATLKLGLYPENEIKYIVDGRLITYDFSSCSIINELYITPNIQNVSFSQEMYKAYEVFDLENFHSQIEIYNSTDELVHTVSNAKNPLFSPHNPNLLIYSGEKEGSIFLFDLSSKRSLMVFHSTQQATSYVWGNEETIYLILNQEQIVSVNTQTKEISELYHAEIGVYLYQLQYLD